MPSLSGRIQALQASAIRKYLPQTEGLRAKGVTVFPLNIGQPDVPTSPLVYEAVARIHPSVLAYAPSLGESSLRAAISRYYQRIRLEVKPEEVVVTMGASEALLAAFNIVCDPGDEVIVFEPFYTNYRSMAGLQGVKLVSVPTHLENGFELPATERIGEAITQRTRAILLCNPANPTGSVISQTRLQTLVELAKERGLFLISDEVYREFVFDAPRATSLFDLSGGEEVSLVIDSVSKRYSACGARVGWLATRRTDVLAAALKYAQMRLSAPTIEQMAMAIVLDQGDTDIQRAKEAYAKRREVVLRLLRAAKIPCGEPHGALYLLADLGVDAEAFTEFMLTEYSGIALEKETVLATPAQAFYLTPEAGKTQVRIAFVVEEQALEKAVTHLVRGREEFLCKN